MFLTNAQSHMALTGGCNLNIQLTVFQRGRRQRDRETERQTDRPTDRETDRQTDRQTDRHCPV